METQQLLQGKPRLVYGQVFAAPKDTTVTLLTVAWVIEMYIRAMNGFEGQRPVKVLGKSHEYNLRLTQRSPIAKKDATKLTEDDIIEHCQWRIESVKAATINQDVTYLHGALKYIRAARRDCREIKAHVIPDARKFLVKNGYIGKSNPRTRVPTDAEIERLLNFFSIPPKIKHQNFIGAMPDMIAFALASSRRIGEICSIERKDVDWDHKDEHGLPAPMYTVRKMKHPTKKDHTKTFPLFPELAVILLRQPVKPGDDRFFPFKKESCSAKYTMAKKVLGILDLRFHDNRREAITNWLKKMTPHQVRHFVSGHESVKMIESNYDVTDPADGHALIHLGTQRAVFGSVDRDYLKVPA